MIIELAPKSAIAKSDSSSDDELYDSELVNNRFLIRKKMIDKFMKDCSSEKGIIDEYIFFSLISLVMKFKFLKPNPIII